MVDNLGTASPNDRQALYHLSVNMSQVLTQLSNTVSKLSANHDSTANEMLRSWPTYFLRYLRVSICSLRQ